MHGEYKVHGGKLVVVDLDVRDGRLSDVQVAGDFSWSRTKRWRISVTRSKVFLRMRRRSRLRTR